MLSTSCGYEGERVGSQGQAYGFAFGMLLSSSEQPIQNRRSDISNANAPIAPHDPETGSIIKGFAGALGILEGTVRRRDRLEDGDQPKPGNVLVTMLTNIGRVPLFPRVAAIVTDDVRPSRQPSQQDVLRGAKTKRPEQQLSALGFVAQPDP
jgi:hypothetical protein